MMMTGLAFPKPTPRLLDKRKAAKDQDAEDRRQRVICRQRSGGVCEVVTVGHGLHESRIGWRCRGRAVHNHHLLSGIGVRNAGRSILAAHRVDVCARCHEEIHGHVLVPLGDGREYAATVLYQRVESGQEETVTR